MPKLKKITRKDNILSSKNERKNYQNNICGPLQILNPPLSKTAWLQAVNVVS